MFRFCLLPTQGDSCPHGDKAFTGRTAAVARHASSSKSMPFLPKPANLGGLVGILMAKMTITSTQVLGQPAYGIHC